MGDPNPVLELKIALASIGSAILAIEDAQANLERQHRDLTHQAELLKADIAKVKK